MIPHKQLTLAEVFDDCQNKFDNDKYHLKSKIPTMKFVCPKMKWEYNPADKSKRRVCHCDNPCTTSSCGRMIYIYPEKIFVRIRVLNAVRKNGMKPTKSESMLRNLSITLKIVSVLRVVKLKMRKRYTPTFFSPVLLSWSL